MTATYQLVVERLAHLMFMFKTTNMEEVPYLMLVIQGYTTRILE